MEDPIPTTESNQLKYRNITRVTHGLVILLTIGMVLQIVSLWSDLHNLDLLNAQYQGFYDELAKANHAVQSLSGFHFISASLFLGTALVFGVWIYRAQTNVRALGAYGLSLTPGWAVGFFFVPVWNLWKPFQGMYELWQASHSPRTWQFVPLGTILRLWWVLWIISGIEGIIFTNRLEVFLNDPRNLQEIASVVRFDVANQITAIFPI